MNNTPQEEPTSVPTQQEFVHAPTGVVVKGLVDFVKGALGLQAAPKLPTRPADPDAGQIFGKPDKGMTNKPN